MNMASRIESTGKKNKIHLSRDTAMLLKPQLVIKREDTVTLKGKGEQETYWYNVQQRSSEGSRSSSNDSHFDSNASSCPEPLMDMDGWEGTSLDGIVGKSKINSNTERLILWNVDILKPMLGSIIAKRTNAPQTEEIAGTMESDDLKHEVQVVIEMDKFDATIVSLTDVSVPYEVETELRTYVATIASGYPNNPCKC
jgi:Adenylate and Guanylate cyclase catalytic domain